MGFKLKGNLSAYGKLFIWRKAAKERLGGEMPPEVSVKQSNSDIMHAEPVSV